MTTDLDVAASVIRASCKRIYDAMIAKGLVNPEVSYSIGVDGMRYIIAYYQDGGRRPSLCTEYGNGREDVMMARIASLPDLEDAARAEHARLLARAAEIAAQHGLTDV